MSKEKTPKDSHYARLRRAHRDSRTMQEATQAEDGIVRLYGLHTVRAAIDNPRRAVRRMLVTRNASQRLGLDEAAALPFSIELVEPKAIDALLGEDAVHQGVMIETEPLKAKALSELGQTLLVLLLDQVTDPHNVGAIMRSAVAFGVGALVTTSRNSPVESGVLAKSASGALEYIDHIEVRNLSNAITDLHKAGFHTIGLDSDESAKIEAAFSGDRIALVVGAEGKGLRQKTRETVSTLARLDLPGEIRSLNVSNAAAVALYAARHYLGKPT